VQALLAAHERPDIVESEDTDPATTVSSKPGATGPGATIVRTDEPDFVLAASAEFAGHESQTESGIVIGGRYTLQQQIGEGGMGTVWVARQTEPVKRTVALKLVRAGMHSKSVLQRFEQERQALAILDHPNIAKVLDGGMTPGGQPYFVMELVRGLPLLKFCDERQLTPRERLELFVPICQAVQHAHQKGIVHRDLKPANILVTITDPGAPGCPKVIDFGVAKAIAGKLTDETMATQFGALVGTLEYMSPEQAGFSAGDVDTRADIYSLGVILYELLTGLRPIDARRVKEATLNQMIRIIQDEEPAKPSTRLSTDQSMLAVAANRQTEPHRLMALLRGELDWIVMKCLEKKRDRRYETASALALDIQRYLADLPVEARPPSAGYRLGKFLRRNKGAAAAAALVCLFLIGGIVSTSYQAARANQARDQAIDQQGLAVTAAGAERRARESEAKARTKAEAAEKRASAEAAAAKAVSEFLELDVLLQADVRHQAQSGAPVKGGLTIREALDRAAARIGDRFRGHQLAEAGIRQAIARSYNSLGESRLGLPHQKRAYELFGEALGKDDPRTLEAGSFLSNCHAAVGNVTASGQLRVEIAKRLAAVKGMSDPQSIIAHQAVAIGYLNGGKIPEAIKVYEELLPAIEHAPMNRDSLRTTTRAGLASAYSRSGRFNDALPLLKEVYDWFVANRPPDDPDTFQSLNSLAHCYYNMGRLQEALTLNERCLKQRSEKYGRAHPDTIQSLNNLALNYFQLGRKNEAIQLLEEACRYRKAQSGEDSPDYLAFESNLAQIYMDVGRLTESINIFEKAYRVFKAKLGPADVSTTKIAEELASAYAAAGRFSDAASVLQEALAPWRARTGDVPFSIVLAQYRLGAAYIDLGRPLEAIPVLEDALRRATSTAGKDNPFTVRMTVALGVARCEAGRPREAIELQEQARTGCNPLELCGLLEGLAAAYERAGDLKKSLELRRAALEDAQKTHGKDERRIAATQARLGATLVLTQSPAEAEPLLRAAFSVQQKRAPDAWTTHDSESWLGAALLGQKKYADAEPYLRAGYEGLKKQDARIPAHGKSRLAEAQRRLVQLAEARKR
jgi:serine/threonine protein kinase